MPLCAALYTSKYIIYFLGCSQCWNLFYYECKGVTGNRRSNNHTQKRRQKKLCELQGHYTLKRGSNDVREKLGH